MFVFSKITQTLFLGAKLCGKIYRFKQVRTWTGTYGPVQGSDICLNRTVGPVPGSQKSLKNRTEPDFGITNLTSISSRQPKLLRRARSSSLHLAHPSLCLLPKADHLIQTIFPTPTHIRLFHCRIRFRFHFQHWQMWQRIQWLVWCVRLRLQANLLLWSGQIANSSADAGSSSSGRSSYDIRGSWDNNRGQDLDLGEQRDRERDRLELFWRQ